MIGLAGNGSRAEQNHQTEAVFLGYFVQGHGLEKRCECESKRRANG
jgi:hypothetical protein